MFHLRRAVHPQARRRLKPRPSDGPRVGPRPPSKSSPACHPPKGSSDRRGTNRAATRLAGARCERASTSPTGFNPASAPSPRSIKPGGLSSVAVCLDLADDCGWTTTHIAAGLRPSTGSSSTPEPSSHLGELARPVARRCDATPPAVRTSLSSAGNAHTVESARSKPRASAIQIGNRGRRRCRPSSERGGWGCLGSG